MKVLVPQLTRCTRSFIQQFPKAPPSFQVRGLAVQTNTSSTVLTETSQGIYHPQLSEQKWDIYASLCIERRPVVSKQLTPIEKRYNDFLSVVELNSSKKSDHEKRHENDLVLLEKIKKGEIDQGTVVTAQDFEDASTAEAMKFVPMSRESAVDKSKDMKSLQRALDSHLVLLVKQQIGENDYKWVYPQLRRNSETSLRAVIDKLLENSFPAIKVQVLGNAPWGFYRYKYAKGVRTAKAQETGTVGAKIFFYKATYISGNYKMEEKGATADKKAQEQSNPVKIADFLWVTRSELKQKLEVPAYYNSATQFLIDED